MCGGIWTDRFKVRVTPYTPMYVYVGVPLENLITPLGVQLTGKYCVPHTTHFKPADDLAKVLEHLQV